MIFLKAQQCEDGIASLFDVLYARTEREVSSSVIFLRGSHVGAQFSGHFILEDRDLSVFCDEKRSCQSVRFGPGGACEQERLVLQ